MPAIKSEKINSFEIGYKKMFDFGAIMSIDYYVNQYTDFFSPTTYHYPNSNIQI